MSACQHLELRRSKTGGWFCTAGGCDFSISERAPPSSNLVSAARELLRLKDQKTDAGNIETSGSWEAVHRRDHMLAEYRAKKGEAWDALRRALQDETSEDCVSSSEKVAERRCVECRALPPYHTAVCSRRDIDAVKAGARLAPLWSGDPPGSLCDSPATRRGTVLARFIRNQVALAHRPPPGCIQLNNAEAMDCAKALEARRYINLIAETQPLTPLRDAVDLAHRLAEKDA